MFTDSIFREGFGLGNQQLESQPVIQPVPIYSCGQDRENLEVNVIPLFFLLISFRVALKAFGFESDSISISRTETKPASHINIFNNIHSETILAKFKLCYCHILTIFDHISNTTKVGGVVELCNDKSMLFFYKP